MIEGHHDESLISLTPHAHQDYVTASPINVMASIDEEKIKIHKCVCYNCFDDGDHLILNGNPCLQPYYKTCMERNVFVWKSPVHGFGVYARKRLRPKEIICLYSGKPGSSETDNPFICKVDGEEDGSILIDASDPNNYSGRWINHSFVPNARLVVPICGLMRHDKKYVVIVECTKEIQQFEEVFIDYGWQYFVNKKKFLNVDYFYNTESSILQTWQSIMNSRLESFTKKMKSMKEKTT